MAAPVGSQGSDSYHDFMNKLGIARYLILNDGNLWLGACCIQDIDCKLLLIIIIFFTFLFNPTRALLSKGWGHVIPGHND
jgi:hypothetical protein